MKVDVDVLTRKEVNTLLMTFPGSCFFRKCEVEIWKTLGGTEAARSYLQYILSPSTPDPEDA